jgi:twitching motility protein PilT
MDQPQTVLDSARTPTAVAESLGTRELIAALVAISPAITDIFFSPMRLPEVRLGGRLVSGPVDNLRLLTPAETTQIAQDLMAERPALLSQVAEEGGCRFSFFLPQSGRFRVQVLKQRGSFAISLRVIPDAVPTMESLQLPPQLQSIVSLPSGLVLVSGPSGSGKTSTVAAILNQINQDRPMPIVTIEDPIEFLHPHRRSTVLQREVRRDVPSVAKALEVSLRLPPHVIFLSDVPEGPVASMALDAADNGHLVIAILDTTDAPRTVERFVRFFPPGREQMARAGVSRALKAIISQRLVHSEKTHGNVGLFEIAFSTPRVRQCLLRGDEAGMTLAETIENSVADGMQSFEMEWEALRRSGTIDAETVLTPPLADRPPVAVFVRETQAPTQANRPRHMGDRLTSWPRN